MQAKDLIEGVEYAVFRKPVRYGGYGWDRPIKAMLVDKSANIVVDSIIVVKEDGTEYVKETRESGLLVTLAEPFVVTRDTHRASGYSGKAHATAEDRNKQVKVKVGEWILKSGGCFRSTWADWEAEVAEKEEWAKTRAAERKAREEGVMASAAARYATLRSLIAQYEADGFQIRGGSKLPETANVPGYEGIVERVEVIGEHSTLVKFKLYWTGVANRGYWYSGAEVAFDLDDLPSVLAANAAVAA